MKIINALNLAGWAAVLFLVGYSLASDPKNYPKSDISDQVYLLKIVQSFMVVDIILILVGMSKGSILGSLAQITGRLIVALYYLTPETEHLSFALMAIIWSIADVNRYLYYVAKNSITTFLRYNSFLILYPIGIYAEMKVINSFIKNNSQTISLEEIWFTRVVQAGICIGMLFLYNYMLKMRRKHLKSDNKG